MYLARGLNTEMNAFTIKPPYIIATFRKEADVEGNFLCKEIGEVCQELLYVSFGGMRPNRRLNISLSLSEKGWRAFHRSITVVILSMSCSL